MKKNNMINRFFAVLFVIAIMCSMSATAFASTNDSYYTPSSGVNYGTYKNATRTSICKYDNLPAGRMKIAYFLDGTNNVEIRFYTNNNYSGGYYSATLINNNGAAGSNGVAYVTIPAGTYYVSIHCSYAKSFSYGYDLCK